MSIGSTSIPVDPLVVFSPAKLNLFLAVTSRRTDGFHDLVSVVAPLDHGDTITIHPDETGRFELRWDEPALPADGSNLILRAVRAFVERTGWAGGAKIEVRKRIPLGAGLGGGSSNAAATLKALNAWAGAPLDTPSLLDLAAGLGSDCPLFLHGGAVVMRGRGERVEPLPAPAAARLAGRRVLVFKPPFGVGTAWAYRRLVEATGCPSPARAGGEASMPAVEAEARVEAWVRDPAAPAEHLLFNSLEGPVFEKYLALPTLLDRLRQDHGWTARMSGSGSASYGFLAEGQPVERLIAVIREAWGDTSWVHPCRIAA